MHILLLVAGAPIVVADLRHHVIPNIYLKFLSLILFLVWLIYGLPNLHYVAWCLVLACFLVTLRFGMGDVKLITILLLAFQPEILVFSTILTVFAVTHIVISTARNRVIPASIPLAPAIFSALITYLATR